MLLSAVSVLVVAQSSSEIPEGIMNNPVLSPPGITDDPGIRSILSGLELSEDRTRNEETNMVVRRTFDTSGLNIVNCHYSGILAVL